jgi:hypothetical protein
MKLYLYLASGKPIVSYPVGGVQSLSHLVYHAHSYKDYIDQIEYALQHDSETKSKERICFAEANSWKKRAEDIHAYIERELGGGR